MAVINCEKCLFYQVNILTHTAEVPDETYPPKKIEKIRKKMKEQDLQELYGGLESSTEHNLPPTSTDSQNITVDETTKTSCHDGICILMVNCTGSLWLPLT